MEIFTDQTHFNFKTNSHVKDICRQPGLSHLENNTLFIPNKVFCSHLNSTKMVESVIMGAAGAFDPRMAIAMGKKVSEISSITKTVLERKLGYRFKVSNPYTKPYKSNPYKNDFEMKAINKFVPMETQSILSRNNITSSNPAEKYLLNKIKKNYGAIQSGIYTKSFIETKPILLAHEE